MNKNYIKIFFLIIIFISTLFLSFNTNKSNLSRTFVNINISTAYAQNNSTTSGYRILVDSLNKSTSREPWIFSLWSFSINLINIALIIILIYIGVINILHLNYDTYQIKKIIFPLIIAILLANFSMFVCRAIIEFSSVISNTLLSNYDQVIEGIKSGLGIELSDAGEWMAYLSGWQLTIAIATQFFITILGVIVALIVFLANLLLAVVLYLRVYIIFILVGISPLAFISMAIPATQKYFNQWWTWFLRFVFMGPLIALIMKVASIMGNANSQSILGRIVVFLAIVALMVVSFMVPWILGGSIMAKLSGYANKASDYIPGISHAKNIGRGFMAGKAQKFKEGQEDMMALGRGLGEGGLSQAKAEMAMAKKLRAQEKLGKIIQAGEGKILDENTLQNIQKKYGQEGINSILRMKAQNKELDKDQLDNIDKMIKNGKIKFKNNAEREKFEKNIDLALKIQQKAYLKDNEIPPEILNPMHGGSATKHAETNLGLWDMARTKGGMDENQQAEIIRRTLKYIDTTTLSASGAKDAFNTIDSDINNNRKLQSMLASDATYNKLRKASSLEPHINTFTSASNANLDTNTNIDQIKKVLWCKQNIDDIDGKPNKTIIEDNLRGGLEILEIMHRGGIDYKNKSSREKFFKDKGVTEFEIIDNFEHNIGRLFEERFQNSANDLARKLKKGHITF